MLWMPVAGTIVILQSVATSDAGICNTSGGTLLLTLCSSRHFQAAAPLKAADRGGKGKKGRQRCCLSAPACIPFLAASSGCLCRPDRLGECRWPK